MSRKNLTQCNLNDAMNCIRDKLFYRSEQKGMGSMTSGHEILGIITEEVGEYQEAVQKNLSDEEKIQELLDIAVGCAFGIASIKSGGTDW